VPEGHSVRRHAQQLATAFAGERVRASSPQGRFAPGAGLLDGELVRGTDAHGKHLFVAFAPGPGVRTDHVLHVHLGLFGRWRLQQHGPDDEPAPPQGAVRVRLSAATATADLSGPTTCAVLSPAEVREVHARLGADPLRPDADPDAAFARISRSKVAIGALLMAQDVVAGVGNVYRAEVLFRAGVDPHLPGRELSREQWDAMWADLVTLMRSGVRAGRIVTTEPADRERPRGRARRVDSFYVYHRTGEPCRRCGTPVLAEPFVARTLYRCPVCQAAA
jgi:formamidopyrimidine-DNA glycosylase